ncbi:RusA family crossover junction endodeoxyribonuclease [Pandoraea pneumonica]|uniref:RusA family crossover junction endodeoxyribonuclease n=1 Tax=Pandoraea pneumonica TaxID=2508299 RepID=A0A5E4RNI0_9BURK|nr:RusA family crossover junction endodeoxyribonuclease [Pandoraea pneumonica]VVD63619.1 RusA family crossover junction endodeoxyribonuclease [Pandoraea pneumonica]
MRQVEFVVNGKPEPKGRARFARIQGHVRTYTPAKTAAYERAVAAAASDAMAQQPIFVGPVMLQIGIHLPIPESWSKKRRGRAATGEIAATKKPDADNVLKAIKDGLNGVVYVDDNQVIDLRVHKRYSDKPCVTVLAIETELERA